MRLTVRFLVLLLVALALFPCQDLSAAAAHEDVPAHHDDCTPLCSCACCGTVMDVLPAPPLVRSDRPQPPAGQTRPEYTPTWKPLLAAASDIQPPRS